MTECANQTHDKVATTTVRFPSTGEAKSYCDSCMNDLLRMHVPFEGTTDPEELDGGR